MFTTEKFTENHLIFNVVNITEMFIAFGHEIYQIEMANGNDMTVVESGTPTTALVLFIVGWQKPPLYSVPVKHTTTCSSPQAKKNEIPQKMGTPV